MPSQPLPTGADPIGQQPWNTPTDHRLSSPLLKEPRGQNCPCKKGGGAQPSSASVGKPCLVNPRVTFETRGPGLAPVFRREETDKEGGGSDHWLPGLPGPRCPHCSCGVVGCGGPGPHAQTRGGLPGSAASRLWDSDQVTKFPRPPQFPRLLSRNRTERTTKGHWEESVS